MAIAATLKHSSTGYIILAGGVQNLTTPAFTSDSNSLLVVTIDFISSGSTQANCTVTSSPSLTWTRRVRAATNGNALPSVSEIWTAPVTTGASTQVVVSATGSGTFTGDGTASAVAVTSVTGQDTVGNPIGLSNSDSSNGAWSGGVSISLGGTTASTSVVIACISCDGDYGAATVAPGTSWTALQQANAASSGWFRSTTEYRIGALSTYDFGTINDPYQHTSAGLELKVASGLVNKTIVAGAGSYALTGTAVTLKRSRIAVAGVGSYALTGSAVTLTKAVQRILVAGAGSYALTGAATTSLVCRRVIAAGAGAYTLTGTAATLIKGKILIAAAGSYTLTGTAATLRKGKAIVAGAGSYALTGTAVTLRRGKLVVVGAGAYALTGTAATLIKSGTAVHGAWDSNVSSATLSNGSRTAAGTFLYARSTDSHAASGSPNYYTEIKLDSTTASYILNAGITDASLANQVYIDSNGALSDSTGFLGTFPSLVFAAGDVVGIAYRPAVGKVWIRVNNGIWNASGAANPATNTGGISYASANPAFAFASGNASSVTTTINTGTVAFVNTPPSAFEPWWGPRVIAAGAGSYTLTGAATTDLKRSRRLDTATAGAYALTGSAITLIRGKNIAAGQGAYLLAGSTVSLRKGKIIIAGAGSYALTGTAATLRKGKAITAGSGSYALTGTAAALLRGKVLAAGAGAYTLTGSTVTLTKLTLRSLAAGAGAYALTGTATTFSRTRKLAATTAGAYALTGSTATDPTIGPWRWVGIGSVVATTSTSHVLNLPADTQAGDLLVAFIASRIASTVAITAPVGWSNAGQRSVNNVVSGSLGQPTAKLAYIVRGASDPDTTFTHPVAPSIATGVIVAYRGVRQVLSPLDASNFGGTATNVTAVSLGGVTSNFAGDLIITGFAGGAPSSYSSINATNPSVASTGSNETRHPKYFMWSERIDASDATGAGTALAVADAVKNTSGATGNITATASVATGHAIVVGAFRFSPGKTITAASGTYDLTGTPAALIAPYRIDATTEGVYALTGSAATLTKRSVLVLSAAAGAYALTGTAITLTKRSPRTLVAGSGSYALTGTAATLLRGRNIAATTAGVYALTGSAVTLTKLRSFVLPAGAGGYVLAGQPVTLKRSRIHIAGVGAYALTGATDVQLRKGSAGSILAGSGSYVLTGTAVSLRHGYTIKAGFEVVTWDSTTLASVTLANSNLTATNTGTTSANQGARGKTWGLP